MSVKFNRSEICGSTNLVVEKRTRMYVSQQAIFKRLTESYSRVRSDALSLPIPIEFFCKICKLMLKLIPT